MVSSRVSIGLLCDLTTRSPLQEGFRMPEIAIPTPHLIDCSLSTCQKPPFRSILRDATADDHARLDATLGALDLCSTSGYRRFLEINAAALLPLERSLERAGVRGMLPDWDDRG